MSQQSDSSILESTAISDNMQTLHLDPVNNTVLTADANKQPVAVNGKNNSVSVDGTEKVGCLEDPEIEVKSEESLELLSEFTIPLPSPHLAKLIIMRDRPRGLYYRLYDTELDMPNIVSLITKDLSEPYSIYTYRYFIHNWPRLCIMTFTEDHVCVGAIVCKLEWHHPQSKRGYIAMLAVEKDNRRKKIGSTLVKLVIQLMQSDGCDEVVLETEITNKPAMQLYERLGFCRDKRLFRYYLNGVDAYRLKLWLK